MLYRIVFYYIILYYIILYITRGGAEPKEPSPDLTLVLETFGAGRKQENYYLGDITKQETLYLQGH